MVDNVTKKIKKISMRRHKQCIVTMDNYITSHKIMKNICKHNLAGLGTAMANNIRVEEIKDIKDKN